MRVFNTLSSASFAHDNANKKERCYLFYDNKLKITQSWIVHTGGGARVTYTTMILGKNTQPNANNMFWCDKSKDNK